MDGGFLHQIVEVVVGDATNITFKHADAGGNGQFLLGGSDLVGDTDFGDDSVFAFMCIDATAGSQKYVLLWSHMT
jgi:hypothetical protein